jgi:hypothetical protein
MPTEALVRVLRTLPELEEIRREWESWPGTRDSDMDLFLTLCRSSPDVLRPQVLVVFRGGKPDAILVGRISQRRVDFRVGYFNVFKPRACGMVFSYGALRGDASAENCSLLVRKIVQSLKDGEADFALLDHVETHSALFRSAQGVPGFLFRDHLPTVQRHWIMELPSSVRELYEGLSYNQRQHFRKTARKLRRTFPQKVRFSRLQDPADLDRMLQDVEEIAKKAYQRRFGWGFMNFAAQRDFLRMEAGMGWLRLYVMYLADRPSAFWIGTVYQQRFCADFTGYDPDDAQHAPGTCLLTEILEELCTEGVKAVDFFFTDSPYKERICNVTRWETSLYVFAPTPKGLCLSAMRALTSLVHVPMRAFLERTDLTQRVKKLWRKMVREKGEPNPS